MLILFGVLIIVASLILGFIILVQNPKGGGLTGVLGGFSNQLIGVRQSTDIMEKGTWIFATVIAALCISSTVFIPKTGDATNNKLLNEMSTPRTAPATTPSTTTPENTGTFEQTPATQETPAVETQPVTPAE